LTTILIEILRPAVIIFSQLVGRFKSTPLHKKDSESDTNSAIQPDLSVLNCRVRLIRQEKNNSSFDVLDVQIVGSIRARDPISSEAHHTMTRISITDITDGTVRAKAVQAQVKQWQMEDSPVFVYNAELGRLPNGLTTLPDWISVARLRVDWLLFPRRGKRSLRFSTSMLSGQSCEELASAMCTFTYENPAFGYIDLQENVHRTKTLAIALAFAVSAADNKLFDCELAVIKDWARANFLDGAVSSEERKLERALDETITFFRDGNKLDNYKICKEIVEIAPAAQRYDILELCLRVAQANGVVAAEELGLLKKLANWLEVDTEKFRAMMERVLPVGMHEVEDTEVILGVTSDMSEEQTRQRLNREYRKWNARVTNFDPGIRSQADYMLNLIAEARSERIG